MAEEQRVKDQRSRFREGSRGGPAGRHEGVFGRVDAVQNGASVTALICSERQVVGAVSSVAGTEPGKAPELSDAGAAGRSPFTLRTSPDASLCPALPAPGRAGPPEPAVPQGPSRHSSQLAMLPVRVP